MAPYASVKSYLLEQYDNVCIPENSLAALIMHFGIEARPAEKIRTLWDLFDELEERLELDSLRGRTVNGEAIKKIADVLEVRSLPELDEDASETTSSAEPLSPLTHDCIAIDCWEVVSEEMLDALASTFKRLGEDDFKRFLTHLGHDYFRYEEHRKVKLRPGQVDHWLNEIKSWRQILQLGCKVFLINVHREGMLDFDLVGRIIEFVGDSNYFKPPLTDLQQELLNLVAA